MHSVSYCNIGRGVLWALGLWMLALVSGSVACSAFRLVHDGTHAGNGLVAGVAQKGPFVPGTPVVLEPLAADLSAVGPAQTVIVLDSRGSFASSLLPKAPLVRVTVEGHFADERTGQVSTASVRLVALAAMDHPGSADVSADAGAGDGGSTEAAAATVVHVNVLTHLAYERTRALLSEDPSRNVASVRAQTQQEVLASLGYAPSATDVPFEQLDVTGEGIGDQLLREVSTNMLNAADAATDGSTLQGVLADAAQKVQPVDAVGAEGSDGSTVDSSEALAPPLSAGPSGGEGSGESSGHGDGDGDGDGDGNKNTTGDSNSGEPSSGSGTDGTATAHQPVAQMDAPCGHVAHGEVDTRVRFRQPIVPYDAQCEWSLQTRLCDDGTFLPWTPRVGEDLTDYPFPTCVVAVPQSCGDLKHGSTQERTRYQSASARGSCNQETQTRTCTDGVLSDWSGTFEHEACTAIHPIIVTASDDSPSGCNLRDAISAANTNTTVGDCASGSSGADLILVARNPIQMGGALAVGDDDDDDNIVGDYDIHEPLTIEGALGNGVRSVVTGHQTSRIFQVHGGHALTVRLLTLEDGRTADAPDHHMWAVRTQAGGCVLASGDLSLDDVEMRNCHTGIGVLELTGRYLTDRDVSEAHDWFWRGIGGAVYAAGDALTISQSVFRNNATTPREGGSSLPGAGGAVATTAATVVIEDTRFASNQAGDKRNVHYVLGGNFGGGGGGALFAFHSQVTIRNSEFENNRAGVVHGFGLTSRDRGGDGGAILLIRGDLTVDGSSFAGNRAGDGNMDDAYEVSGGHGGAIMCEFCDVVATHTVFHDNHAGSLLNPIPESTSQHLSFARMGSGGAIYHSQGSITLKQCSLTDNGTGTGHHYDSPAPQQSGDGGAVFSWGLSFSSVSNTTFHGNVAASEGGALFVHGGPAEVADGAGTYLGDVSMDHVTMVGNQCAHSGCGFYYIPEFDYSNYGTLRDVGKARVKNSIMAGNTRNDVANDCGGISVGSSTWQKGFVSAEGNVFGANGRCHTEARGNDRVVEAGVLFLDPPAADAQGSRTMALQLHSPAGGLSDCRDVDGNLVAEDQRGVSRPTSSCDAGAHQTSAP